MRQRIWLFIGLSTLLLITVQCGSPAYPEPPPEATPASTPTPVPTGIEKYLGEVTNIELLILMVFFLFVAFLSIVFFVNRRLTSSTIPPASVATSTPPDVFLDKKGSPKQKDNEPQSVTPPVDAPIPISTTSPTSHARPLSSPTTLPPNTGKSTIHQKLAHYRIEELLGEGSFAWVYRAFDEKFEQYVALKVLKPIWMSDFQAVKRFRQEAITARRLRHTYIVNIYDVGDVDGQVYLSQFLVQGETLASRLERGPFQWKEALDILRDVGLALDYAHGEGIIHRDIKPQNILLGTNDEAYLCDFGLVLAVEGSAHISSSVSMIGTGHYVAPSERVLNLMDKYAAEHGETRSGLISQAAIEYIATRQ